MLKSFDDSDFNYKNFNSIDDEIENRVTNKYAQILAEPMASLVRCTDDGDESDCTAVLGYN